MTGRRTLLTPELSEAILNTIRLGNSIKTAALVNHVGDSTIHVWRNRGEEEEKRLLEPGSRPREREAPFVDFARGLREAQADARRTHVNTIRLAATPHEETTTVVREVIGRDGEVVTLTETRTSRVYDWRASAFWLERCAREEFGKAPVEITGAGGGPIEVESREALLARGHQLADELAGKRAQRAEAETRRAEREAAQS